jgi:hypothetical protein
MPSKPARQGFDKLSPNEQQAPQHRNALSCDGKKRSQINS